MCLAVPGKIISIDCSVPELKMAKIDFGGIVKSICIQWVDAAEGDYVLAHAGIAISILNKDEAEETLADFERISRSLGTNPPE